MLKIKSIIKEVMMSEIRKIIMEELIGDIRTESVSIYDLVYQSFKVEGLTVERAKERTAEVTGEFTDRLEKRIKDLK